MNNLEAIEVLTRHNKWRRGNDDIEPTDPKQIGLAIERAIAVMEAADKLVALPTEWQRFCEDYQRLKDALEGKP